MQIRKGRLSGLGSNTRRYIEPKKAQRELRKRQLTSDESRNITKMFAAIPRTKSGDIVRWDTKEGEKLITYVRGLRDTAVPLSEISELMGMTRQALSLHIKKAEKLEAKRDESRISSLTKAEAKRLAEEYQSLPVSTNGSRIWASEPGIQLISNIQRYVDRGVPIGVSELEPTKRSQSVVTVSDALGLPASVVGRMVAMKDALSARI